VALQESFLEAFLKGNDPEGWSTGKVPRVGLVLRKGDVSNVQIELLELYADILD